MPPKNLPTSEYHKEQEDTEAPGPDSPKEIHAPKTPRRNISPGKWSPMKAIGAILVFILLAGIIWYVFSDSDSAKKAGNEASTELADLGTSSARAVVPITPAELKPSLYTGWVKLSPGTAAQEIYPEKEYVTLDVTQKNLSSVDISGWTFRNSAGETARLSFGNVGGGDRVFVSTGFSPTGSSFRVNKCSGYLEQFLDFVPPLALKCPRPSSEKSYSSLERVCQTFVRTMKPCEIYAKEFPAALSSSCRVYVNTSINHSACVAAHRSDADFYTNEWRIYLNQSRELWADKGETIMLLDAEGNLVGSVKY